MTRAARLAAPWAALAFAACNTNFAPQYLVTDLRILGARAEVVGPGDVADPDTGETLRLTALVANPAGLPVTVRWKACLPQQGQAVSPCLDTSALRDPEAIAGPGVVDLGEGTSIDVAVPDALAPLLQLAIDKARATPSLACTLYVELPVLAVASAPGEPTRVAVKTARVTPWREVVGTSLDGIYVRNRNPAVASVRAAPAPDGCHAGTIVARPCSSSADCDGAACVTRVPGSSSAAGQCADPPLEAAEQVLCASASDAPTAVQIYNQCLEDGTRQAFFEDITYQWYVTGGKFKGVSGGSPGSNGNVVDERVTFTRPAGPFTMWVVIRDGRGGEDWLRRDFP